MADQNAGSLVVIEDRNPIDINQRHYAPNLFLKGHDPLRNWVRDIMKTKQLYGHMTKLKR